MYENKELGELLKERSCQTQELAYTLEGTQQAVLIHLEYLEIGGLLRKH